MPNPSSSISENCISIIQKCTNIDPNERPSFAEIIEEMKVKSFKLAEEVDSAIINNRYCELKKNSDPRVGGVETLHWDLN